MFRKATCHRRKNSSDDADSGSVPLPSRKCIFSASNSMKAEDGSSSSEFWLESPPPPPSELPEFCHKSISTGRSSGNSGGDSPIIIMDDTSSSTAPALTSFSSSSSSGNTSSSSFSSSSDQMTTATSGPNSFALSSSNATAAAAAAGGSGVSSSSQDTPELRAWVQGQVQSEVQRLNSQGVKCIPVTVKNMGVIMDGNRCINRLELDTNFDFEKIKQILISDPSACPFKPHYAYVNVVLFTSGPVPILACHLYDTRRKRNQLKDWVFINNKLQRAHHRIDELK